MFNGRKEEDMRRTDAERRECLKCGGAFRSEGDFLCGRCNEENRKVAAPGIRVHGDLPFQRVTCGEEFDWFAGEEDIHDNEL